MSSSTPTIRSISEAVGYSIATVSEALRDSSKVNPATRRKIQQAAREMGYKRNSLVCDVMSRMRRSQTVGYNGNIAVLETDEFHLERQKSAWHKEIFAGAAARSGEFGFKLEFFNTDPFKKSLKRLGKILDYRNIKGVIVPSYTKPSDFSGLDWSKFSVVQFDYCLKDVRMHTVCPDHHLSLLNALKRLEEKGFQRLGLMVEDMQDERILMKWNSAFTAFTHEALPSTQTDTYHPYEIDKAGFLRWYKSYRPDVIVGHRTKAISWLKESGVDFPREVGFFSLNIHDSRETACGLDLLPGKLGAIAIDVLVSQIHRQNYGIPDIPSTTMLEGKWRSGPTILEKPLVKAMAS